MRRFEIMFLTLSLAVPIASAAPRPARLPSTGGIDENSRSEIGVAPSSGTALAPEEEKGKAKPLTLKEIHRKEKKRQKRAKKSGAKTGGGGGGHMPPTPKVVLPSVTSCYPRPPQLWEIKVKVHIRAGPRAWTIDSTPKTCDREFCSAAGFANRRCCPLGQEGSPSRVACELMALGKAPDGVAGPRWVYQGPGKMERHPENPFLAIVTFPPEGGTGKIWACSNREKICGGTYVSY